MSLPASENEVYFVAWLVFLTIVGTWIRPIADGVAKIIHRRR